MATKLLMAKSPAEAIDLKSAAAAFLAGGTEINRLGSDIAADADTLISLKKCSGLDGIEAEGGSVKIGSMCTFQKLTESDKVPAYLKEAARYMASRTKRNMATIGGNIAAFRSDSYLLPVLFAVCARVDVLTKEGVQNICINSFKEAAEAGEEMLITAVIVPENIRVVSKRYSNTAQSHAVLTMSSAITEKGFTLAAAVKNCGILRFRTFEDMVRKDPDISEEDVMAFFREADSLKISDDMFGSEEYKRYLLGVTAYDFCRKLAGKEV